MPKLCTDHKLLEQHKISLTKVQWCINLLKCYHQCQRQSYFCSVKKKSHFPIQSDSFIIWWASYSIKLTLGSDRPVAHLMSNGESDRQPRVLVDVAAAVRLTHPGQMGQTQSLAGLVHPSTDVFPGDHSQS